MISSSSFLPLISSLSVFFLFLHHSSTVLAENSAAVLGDQQLIPSVEEDILSAEKRVPHPFGWRQPGTGRVRSFHAMDTLMPAEFAGRRYNRFADYGAPGRPLFVRYMRGFGPQSFSSK